jgi:hypothetical protein
LLWFFCLVILKFIKGEHLIALGTVNFFYFLSRLGQRRPIAGRTGDVGHFPPYVQLGIHPCQQLHRLGFIISLNIFKIRGF